MMSSVEIRDGSQSYYFQIFSESQTKAGVKSLSKKCDSAHLSLTPVIGFLLLPKADASKIGWPTRDSNCGDLLKYLRPRPEAV